MTALTARQHEVLLLVMDLTDLDGRPPTVEELRECLGVASKYTVACHLDALVKKGYLERRRGARGLRVLKVLP